MIDERDPIFRRAMAPYSEIVGAHRESVERVTAEAEKRASDSAALKAQDEQKRQAGRAEAQAAFAEAEAKKAESDPEKKNWANRPAPSDEDNYEFLQFEEGGGQQQASPPPPPPVQQQWTPPPAPVAPPPPEPAPAPAPRRRAAAGGDDDEDFAEHKWWAG